jgi:hypothetical protein
MKSQMTRVTAGVLVFGVLTLTACGGAEPLATSEDGTLPWNGSGSGVVTDTYGLAYVREGSFFAEAKVKPWSSYWFPHSDTSLYEPISGSREAAPLQKYDQWAKKAKKTETSAAAYEKTAMENHESDSWAGLCNAWSKASVMEKEPANRKPVDVDGVKFSSFDLKALLIKSYDNTVGFVNYGRRYNGERSDDFNDIYPDQFHRVLQATLFEKGQAFIMDRDPSIQVWNVPVYKAEVLIARDPSNAGVMHVRATLGTAGTRDDTDFIGTWQVNYEYYYDLYGVSRPDGSFEVRSGAWTGASLDNHPDFVTVIPEKTVRQSDNPQLKTEWVDEILTKAQKATKLEFSLMNQIFGIE